MKYFDTDHPGHARAISEAQWRALKMKRIHAWACSRRFPKPTHAELSAIAATSHVAVTHLPPGLPVDWLPDLVMGNSGWLGSEHIRTGIAAMSDRG